MTDWYSPNQQAVRADESGAAEEGTGGAPAVTDTSVSDEEPEAPAKVKAAKK